MRQNARRSKKKKHVALPFLLLAAATSCAMIFAFAGRSSLTGREFAPSVGTDPRAVALDESPFARFREENDPGTLSYRISSRIELADGASPGELCVGSPIQNACPLRAELILDDTGETVFSSGILLPGQQLESAALDMPLAAGEYAATASFYAMDSDGESELGRVTESVTIAVLS